MDDVEDQYIHPTRNRENDNRPGDGTRTGFVVKGGPWEQQSVPDTRLVIFVFTLMIFTFNLPFTNEYVFFFCD